MEVSEAQTLVATIFGKNGQNDWVIPVCKNSLWKKRETTDDIMCYEPKCIKGTDLGLLESHFTPIHTNSYLRSGTDFSKKLYNCDNCYLLNNNVDNEKCSITFKSYKKNPFALNILFFQGAKTIIFSRFSHLENIISLLLISFLIKNPSTLGDHVEFRDYGSEKLGAFIDLKEDVEWRTESIQSLFTNCDESFEPLEDEDESPECYTITPKEMHEYLILFLQTRFARREFDGNSVSAIKNMKNKFIDCSINDQCGFILGSLNGFLQELQDVRSEKEQLYAGESDDDQLRTHFAIDAFVEALTPISLKLSHHENKIMASYSTEYMTKSVKNFIFANKEHIETLLSSYGLSITSLVSKSVDKLSDVQNSLKKSILSMSDQLYNKVKNMEKIMNTLSIMLTNSTDLFEFGAQWQKISHESSSPENDILFLNAIGTHGLLLNMSIDLKIGTIACIQQTELPDHISANVKDSHISTSFGTFRYIKSYGATIDYIIEGSKLTFNNITKLGKQGMQKLFAIIRNPTFLITISVIAIIALIRHICHSDFDILESWKYAKKKINDMLSIHWSLSPVSSIIASILDELDTFVVKLKYLGTLCVHMSNVEEKLSQNLQSLDLTSQFRCWLEDCSKISLELDNALSNFK